MIVNDIIIGKVMPLKNSSEYKYQDASTSIKSNESGTRVAQKNIVWTNFKDRAIDKLFIKSGNRFTVKFKNVKATYLNGLILRYSPLTQKKLFYSVRPRHLLTNLVILKIEELILKT